MMMMMIDYFALDGETVLLRARRVFAHAARSGRVISGRLHIAARVACVCACIKARQTLADNGKQIN